MNWINDLFSYLSKIFQWWIIVLPWERGIRVRLGKRVKVLTEGTYLRFPIIDQVFVQTTRTRFLSMPIQTLTTKDGKTITINASVGYNIEDILKLYNSIYSPETTILSIAMGAISEYVASHDFADCLPDMIEQNTSKMLSGNQYGLGDVTFKITGYAVVRTFRFIQDHSWFPPEKENKKYDQ